MIVREQIRRFIEETFFVTGLDDDDSFLASGAIDSMGMLQLVGFVEEHFGMAVADEDLVPENLDSVARLAAFIEGKMRQVG